MDEECSEAAPSGPGFRAPDRRHQPSVENLWSQPALWANSEVIIRTQLVVDGPGGLLSASCEALDFWSGERIACEVRPSMRFPGEAHLALLWLEERQTTWLTAVAPF